MFTFSGQPSLPRRGLQKMQPLPDFFEPTRLDSLPPLPFYIEAADPLPLDDKRLDNKNSLQQQVERYIEQRNKIDQQYSKLYEDYIKLKKQHQDLKNKYREGQQMFLQIQGENMRMYQQLEQLKLKKQKQQRSRISLGNRKKQIPIVKISVPNPKAVSHESQKQSIYRQLKAASEQLAHMRKILQSEKQKSQHSIHILNKNVEQLTNQKQHLKQEIGLIREQNRLLKQDSQKFRSLGNLTSTNWNGTFGGGQYMPQTGAWPVQGNVSVRTKGQDSELQKVKSQLQRLERVHKSCDILLASKQTQVLTLRLELQKAAKYNADSESQFHRTQSNRKLKANSSFIFDRESAQKQKYEANTLLPNSSQKKIPVASLYPQDYTSLLQKHLQLSTSEMKSIQRFLKQLVRDFIARIDSLKNELQWANKKTEHQKFQLERVYQLLRDKKIQLDNCYNDLRSVSQAHRTPIKQQNRDDEQMKSILKGRRNLSA